MRNQWIVLAALLLLCLAVGAGAGWATSQSVSDWYPTLAKPWWNPPNWLFGPVWTALYILMAVAAWLVWKTPRDTTGAMILFFSQLVLNFAWSFLFFGARSPWLGLLGIIFLWLALAATTWAFFNARRTAGLLMLPYLAWVSFAGLLNFTIWQIN